MVDVSFFMNIVITFGYLGIFLISLVGTLSLFIPVPTFLVIMAAGALLNPLLVGIVSGVGAAIGEMLGYAIGIGLIYGHKKILKKHSKKSTKKEKIWMKFFRKWFNKRLGPVIIFIFAVSPLPDKIIGIFCGVIKYDPKKFFITMLIGKIVLGLILAYIGFYGLGFIEEFL